MEQWKKNIYICCFATFIVAIGMGQMAPILPIYVKELGVSNPNDISFWSGIIFGINFITLAIFSPIWGKLADKYGRKLMMLRATLWLAFIMTAMGFARDVFDLTILRFIQGAMSGYLGAVTPLIAQETPNNRLGWAMGMFFASQVSGALTGPLFGGWLAETLSCRETFIAVGIFCFLGFLAIFFIKETSHASKKAQKLSFREAWNSLENKNRILTLYIINFFLQITLMSTQPLITVYIMTLIPDSPHIALISGAVFAVTGFASLILASPIGALSDRIGAEKILLASLIIAGIASLPQAIVSTPLELAFLRFFLGVSAAGLLPTINSLIKQNIDTDYLGHVFGLNQTFQYSGMFLGSILGGYLVGIIGIPMILFSTGFIFFANAAFFWTIFFKKTSPIDI